MLSWARRRQLYYLLGALAFFVVIGLTFYLIYRPRPTCVDGVKNQNETGIDCGGPCSLACAPDVVPLKIDWVRPLKVATGWYDVAALVENENVNFGLRRAPYTIYLYDQNHLLVAKQTGETFVNAGEKFVVFASRLDTGTKVVDQAFLEFDKNLTWEKAKPLARVINLERQNFVNTPRPQLQIKITNLTLDPIYNLRISTVLSDNNSNALASSATFVDKIKGQESKNIFLTWPASLPVEPSYIDLYWRLNSFELTD